MLNLHRIQRLIKSTSTAIGLDLRGLNVLTEAASGYYGLTAPIAAMAGAERVFCLCRDSRYAKALEAQSHVADLSQRLGAPQSIEFLTSRNDPRIEQSHIVTNLGFVRPIDADFLSRLSPLAVIPLMKETWEHRPSDLDLAFARRLGIPVLGTNENHRTLQIFAYVGHLAVKLLLQLDVELFKSFIIVVGSGEFGKATEASLTSVGAKVKLVEPVRGESLASHAWDDIKIADAIVFTEFDVQTELAGPNSISFRTLQQHNPGLCIGHVAGTVDVLELSDSKLLFAPTKVAGPGFMSVATDYVGPRPLIELHSGGLAVGAAMARARALGMHGQQCELHVLNTCELAQGFAEVHYCHDR